MALNSTNVGTRSEGPQPIPTFDAPPSALTATATPGPLAAVLPLPPVRLLGAVDEQTAWRAATGDCPATPASPELTSDGGTTWKMTDATGPAKVTALQRLLVTDESVLEMVGLSSADCSPQFVKTFIAGDNYSSYPARIGGTWYVDPANRSSVHSPLGDTTAPCDSVVTLAVLDNESALALCSDGNLFVTTDSATTWSESARVPGAVNVAVTGAGYLVAAVGVSECAGVQLLNITTARDARSAGCYPSIMSPAKLSGNVTMSDAAGTLWLWAGESLARSADGGATWK